MEMRVNATRMQLLNLRRRLRMAQRGHKLLKDKRDELMRQFLEVVQVTKEIRTRVEELLAKAAADLALAGAVTSRATLLEALLYPKQRLELEVQMGQIVSARVPRFRCRWGKEREKGGLYPYGLAETPPELDAALRTLAEALPLMVDLAEKEKAAELLAEEVEKTRRRVNALEYVLIPQLTNAVRFITMKLDEAERGNLTRLMKLKEIVRGEKEA